MLPLWDFNTQRHNLQRDDDAPPPLTLVEQLDNLLKSNGHIGASEFNRKTVKGIFAHLDNVSLPDMRDVVHKFAVLATMKRHFRFIGRKCVRQLRYNSMDLMEESTEEEHTLPAFNKLFPCLHVINEDGNKQLLCAWYANSDFCRQGNDMDSRKVAAPKGTSTTNKDKVSPKQNRRHPTTPDDTLKC